MKNYPVMPGGISRNYPSTGSSVLLPVNLSSINVHINNNNKPVVHSQVLICGGTLPDSNENAAEAQIFLPAAKTCGRLTITAQNPKWEMEEMPLNRVMGDMILLPTGDVLIINGAAKGTAGWGAAREPVLNPVIYCPKINRFRILCPSLIPRLYHSTAHLLSDGRVLVGGSNPNVNYNFSALFPTELSLEAFYPPYFNLMSNRSRPSISTVKPGAFLKLKYTENFSLGFKLRSGDLGKIFVTMVAPSFTTHSFAMNQRLLVLELHGAVQKSHTAGDYIVQCSAPPTAALAPPGYYQLFLVNDGVPSKAVWVQMK